MEYLLFSQIQLQTFVKRCTGIEEVMGSNPVEAWISFSGLNFHYCSSSAGLSLQRSLSCLRLYPQFKYMTFIYSQSFITTLNHRIICNFRLLICVHLYFFYLKKEISVLKRSGETYKVEIELLSFFATRDKDYFRRLICQDGF